MQPTHRKLLIPDWTRRHLLRIALATMASPASLGAKQPRTLRVGAIRWDAWYDPADGAVAKAVERSLGPHRYHSRMPFFGKETGPDSVRIDGYSQAILDREILDAAQAGLAYWAFVAYPLENSMSNALKLYLKSSEKAKINFCFVADLGLLARPDVTDFQIRLLASDTYEKVLDARPLYYLLIPDESFADRLGGINHAKQLLDGLRQSIMQRGLRNPYIVALNQQPDLVASVARALGGDGIGAYAINHNRPHASFLELVHAVESLWDQLMGTGLPVVPPISTGFDRRPRAENPVPWEHRPAPPTGTVPDVYYETATPDQIAVELRACLEWMALHPEATPADTALIYAWNEYDEGGWLSRTYPDDRDRLKAIRQVLINGR